MVFVTHKSRVEKDRRYTISANGKARRRRYNRSPKGRARAQRWRRSLKGRRAIHRYNVSTKGQAKRERSLAKARAGQSPVRTTTAVPVPESHRLNPAAWGLAPKKFALWRSYAPRRRPWER